jgi:hypothetical protein
MSGTLKRNTDLGPKSIRDLKQNKNAPSKATACVWIILCWIILCCLDSLVLLFHVELGVVLGSVLGWAHKVDAAGMVPVTGTLQ